METTRRDFMGAAALFAAMGAMSGCRSTDAGDATAPRMARGGGSWYKGMLHVHTALSDGKALPEQAADAYRRAGYNFLAITDHTRAISDAGSWRYVRSETGGWPYSLTPPQVENARRRFPQTLRTRRLPDGSEMVRITPLDELKGLFDEPGRFLLMGGTEVTRHLQTPKTNAAVHMNYVNLDGLIESCRDRNLIETFRGEDWTSRRVIHETFEEVNRFAAACGKPPYMFMVNHPLSGAYSVQPEDLVAEPSLRFIEIHNGGSNDVPKAPFDRGGYELDRFWDVVNTLRAREGETLVYGVASDDTHTYPDCGLPEPEIQPEFAHSCVMVHAAELTPAAIFAAMDRGDFYSVAGDLPPLDDVSFDKGVLRVTATARADEMLKVSFIVSKRDFDPACEPREPGVTDSLVPSDTKRTVNYYPDPHIGMTVRTVTVKSGETVEASYPMAASDLYVRARVESTRPNLEAKLKRTVLTPQGETAWTQPYR